MTKSDFYYEENLERQIKVLQKEKDNLIKYLKHKVKIFENRVMEHGFDDDIIKMGCYQDILEKVKSGKYD